MLFAVRFHDVADGLPIRQAHTDAHMEWIAKTGNAVVAAGPLRSGGPESTPIGALWVVRGDSIEQVRAMLDEDPFVKNGLRAKTEIYQWTKAWPATISEI